MSCSCERLHPQSIHLTFKLTGVFINLGSSLNICNGSGLHLRKKPPLMSRNWSHTKALVLLEAGNKQCLSQNTNRQNDSETLKKETKQGHFTMLSKRRWKTRSLCPHRKPNTALSGQMWVPAAALLGNSWTLTLPCAPCGLATAFWR